MRLKFNYKKTLAILSGMLLLAAVLISNFTFARFLFPSSGPFRYCADYCKFEYTERWSPRENERLLYYFDEYVKEVNNGRLVIYRWFTFKWWHFWEWAEYLFHPRWKYPYAASDAETGPIPLPQANR